MEPATRWHRSLQGVLAGTLIAALVMWPTAVRLAAVWTETVSYGYAWFVIPMFAYLIGWHFRQDMLACHPQPALSGVFVAVAAATCWSLAEAMNLDVGRQLALVLVMQAIAISALGWRLYRHLFPIMGLLFLMIPSGDLLLTPLRKLTVVAMDVFVSAINLPHRVDGFFVVIDGQSYEVLNECAGLSHVLLAFFLAYCFGLMFFRSWIKIAALALLGAVLGILSNVLRVSTIIWIDWIHGTQMPLTGHTKIQWVALAIVLGVLFFVMIRLEPEPPRPLSTDPSQENPAHSAQYAPVVAGVAVLVITGVASLLLKDDIRPRSGPLSLRPQTAHGWEPADSGVDWVSDSTRNLASLTLSYRRDGRTMNVMLIEPLSSEAKFQESQLAPRNQEGWNEIGTERLETCAASKCVRFVHSRWLQDRNSLTRHVFYTYALGDFRTDSKLALRIATGWQRLIRSGLTPRLIGFTVDGDIPSSEELVAMQEVVGTGWVDPGK